MIPADRVQVKVTVKLEFHALCPKDPLDADEWADTTSDWIMEQLGRHSPLGTFDQSWRIIDWDSEEVHDG